jgi:hypothetical protein
VRLAADYLGGFCVFLRSAFRTRRTILLATWRIRSSASCHRIKSWLDLLSFIGCSTGGYLPQLSSQRQEPALLYYHLFSNTEQGPEASHAERWSGSWVSPDENVLSDTAAFSISGNVAVFFLHGHFDLIYLACFPFFHDEGCPWCAATWAIR